MTGGFTTGGERPAIFKTVGVCLAIASGLFIGVSFVLKKKGLLAANVKDGKEAGEGYGYLRNAWWWSGMILMIIGEICNFAAYAFVDAILVTPMGALSVVITAILSSIFLKERLSFIGKIGCFMCIVGSVVIVINAPAQSSVSNINDMKNFILSPGFLSYAGVVVVSCVCIIIWIAPRYGTKSMMVYLTVCSLIGGLSVVATQGLGAAIITQIGGTPQFNQWFIYVLLVFVITTLLVEIVYLNKALNLFNAALVTPTYYVIFTSATIVTSAILFRGFKGSASSIATVVMGFLQICSGVVLLQLSKSSKNVPDTEIFRGDLDQIRTVAEQSEPESEPKADAIRGTAAIIRRFSVARQMAEADEARKIHAGRMRDLSTPQTVGESVEWDGVRRRVTWTGQRRNTLSGQHPPLGMSKIPDEEEGLPETSVPTGRRRSMSVDEAMRQHVYGSGLPDEQDPHPETFIGRMRGLFIPNQQSRTSLHDEAMQDIPSATTPEITSANNPYRPRHHTDAGPTAPFIELPPISQSSPQVNRVTFHDPQALAEEPVRAHDFAPTIIPRVRPVSSSGNTDYQPVPARAISPPSASPALRPGSGSSARRQFSFQFLHRHQHSAGSLESTGETGKAWKNTVPAGKTEEELMGLVKGDSVSSSSSAHVREVADGACSSDEDNPAGWREKDWESRGEKK